MFIGAFFVTVLVFDLRLRLELFGLLQLNIQRLLQGPHILETGSKVDSLCRHRHHRDSLACHFLQPGLLHDFLIDRICHIRLVVFEILPACHPLCVVTLLLDLVDRFYGDEQIQTILLIAIQEGIHDLFLHVVVQLLILLLGKSGFERLKNILKLGIVISVFEISLSGIGQFLPTIAPLRQTGQVFFDPDHILSILKEFRHR